MITELLVRALTGLVRGVLAVLPDDAPPSWFLDAGNQWSNLMNQVSGLSYWLPVTLAVQVTAAILGCVVIGFTIKVVRLVASYFTAGGGSAG